MIEFEAKPFQVFRPTNPGLGKKETEICDQEIRSLLSKNGIFPTLENKNPSFLSTFL